MDQEGIVLSDEYKLRLRNIAVAIQRVLSNVSCSALMLREKTYVATRFQSASSINFQHPVDRLLFNVIIDHCMKAEIAGPGAFGHTLDIILDRILSSEDDDTDLALLADGSFRPTWQQLQSLLKRDISDATLEAMLFEALDLAGLEGRIFVDQATGSIPSVERVNGYNFHVNIPVPFSGTCHDVRVVIIDGFIESVSEIHHLLQHFSECKETLLLVARAMSDDVIHTLKVNMARKTLDVIPAIVKYDFEGINVLNDIALVCSTDVISSTKGQLITGIDKNNIPKIKSLTCKDDVLTLVNENVVYRTEQQVHSLLEKSKEVELEQLRKIYDDRVRSLTPSSVRIRVVGDRSFTSFAEKIDVSLRVVRSSLRHGFFSKQRVRKSTRSLAMLPDPLPLETAFAVMAYSRRCIEMLKQTQAVIIA